MEMADRHVYANPSYPSHFEAAFTPPSTASKTSNLTSNTATNNAATMQIGGLPFYLPRDSSDPMPQKHNEIGESFHNNTLM